MHFSPLQDFHYWLRHSACGPSVTDDQARYHNRFGTSCSAHHRGGYRGVCEETPRGQRRRRFYVLLPGNQLDEADQSLGPWHYVRMVVRKKV